MMLLLASAAWAAPKCGPEAVEQAVSRVRQAFVELRAEDLPAARDELLQALGCVASPLPPSAVANVFEALGLVAFVEGQRDRAARLFAAERMADPSRETLPEDLVPPMHPIRGVYRSILVAGGRLVEVPEGDDRWLCNGRPCTARPLDWPILVQERAPDGSVEHTWIVEPSDPWPLQPSEPSLAGRPRLQRGLAWASVGSGVAAAAAYGVGWWSRNAWEEAGDSTIDSVRYYQLNHGALITSAGLAAASVSLGVGAFLVGRF